MVTFIIIKSNESLSEVTGYFSSDYPLKGRTKDIDSWVNIAFENSKENEIIAVKIDGDENTSDPLNVHASNEFLRKINERYPSIENIISDMKNNFPS